jgi:serine/threonine protein kinase
MARRAHNVGPYEPLECIGRGGGSRVWRARHVDGGPLVALKLLDAPAAHALREAHATRALDHPNIVALLDTGIAPHDLDPEVASPSSPYLVMELAAGGSLAGLRHSLPWPQIRDLLLTTLEALAHAHARGVTHLDLKPANVLLRAPGSLWRDAMLADFGLARVARSPHDDLTAPRFAGTPAFMAPEQIRDDRRRIGPWTDLYSLGCLAWHLLCGHAPFHGGDVDDVLRAHLSSSLPALRPRVPVPDGLLGWLKSLLAKDPAKRFAFAAQAARALHAMDSFSGASVTLRHWGERPSPRRDLLAHPHLGPRLFQARDHPFTGRRDLRIVADELLVGLRDAPPHVLSLHGPPGVGTSRAARWIGERAHELGRARVVDCRVGDPLEALTLGLLSADDAPSARERSLRLSAAEGKAIATADADSIEALALGARGDRALEALCRALTRASRAHPVVVWFDGPLGDHTTRWLGMLTEHAAGARALVVTSSHDPLPGAHTHLALGPLGALEHAALINALLPLSPPTRRALERATRGHPRATIETLTAWVRGEHLEPTEAGWSLTPGEHGPVEYGRACAARVLAALSPDTPELAVRVGASMGAELEPTEWRRACANAGAALPDTLPDALVDAGALTREGAGWVWAHEPMRRGLRRDHDARVHRAIADALDELHGVNSPAVAARVATHRGHAREHDAALDAALLAIAHASPRGDAGDLARATDLLRRCADALPEAARHDRHMRGLMMLSRAHARRGEHLLAMAHARAIDGALAGEPLAGALLAVGHPMRAALALSTATPDPNALDDASAARALCVLSRIALARAQHDAAHRALRRARARAAKAPRRDASLQVELDLCAARLSCALQDELGARSHLDRVRARLPHDAPIDLARAHLVAAHLALRFDDPQAAHDEASHALELTRRARASDVGALTSLADAALRQRDLDALDAALARARSSHHLEPLSTAAARLDLIDALASSLRRDLDALDAALGRALDLLDTSDVAHADLARRATRLARSCARRGLTSPARRAYLTALEQWTRLDAPDNALALSHEIEAL